MPDALAPCVRRPRIIAIVAVASLIGFSQIAAAQTVNLVGDRNPANEYYVSKIETAIPGVDVTSTLTNYDAVVEKEMITLSSGSDDIDLLYVNDPLVKQYAKAGWLLPLDDLWIKYTSEYDLGDIPDSVLEAFRFEGKLYAVPMYFNSMFFFYRSDLFEEAGLESPRTFDEYHTAAAKFNTDGRAGTTFSLKPVDAALNETHWYMNAHGAAWFDEEWKPAFNSPEGVRAIEAMRETAKYAPPGFTSHANDEAMISFQQDLAVMGLQWFSRAAAMDDPAKSKVVGKIEWAVPPGGGSRLAVDGFAISAFSETDPDLLFLMLMTAIEKESMRGGAGVGFPPRNSLLGDPELQEQYRFYPAALETIQVAKPFPSLPEFLQLGDIITRQIHDIVAGDAPVKETLDALAAEAEDILRRRGYYQ